MGSQSRPLSLKQRAQKLLDTRQSNFIEADFKSLINELNLHQIQLELQNEDLRQYHFDLEATQNKYDTLYEFVPVACFTFDTNGFILEANNAAAKLLGISASSLIKKSFVRYIAPDCHHVYSHHRQRVLTNPYMNSCQIKLLQRSGPIFSAEMNSRALVNSQTGETHILSFISHLTEYKQEYDLSMKNASVIGGDKDNVLGELLNGVVSELNGPLAVIMNYMQGVLRRLESGKFEINQIQHALELAIQQSHRAADIILRMKNFHYNASLQYEMISLNELINEAIALIKNEIIDLTVAIHYRPRNPDLKISIDKIHIQQVILNLARNALEACKDAKVADPKLKIEVAKFSNKFLEISIIDNGPGFDKDISHQLVDPSFTTKSYGVGLGLALSRRIIEAHGGELSMELNPAYGACFKFTLPLCEVTA